MNAKYAALGALLAALGTWTSASAHHSFSAEFDAEKPVDLTGVVTRVSWANPHIFFYIDVETAAGSHENWAIEMGSPNGLMRRGWTRNSLQIGDIVSVEGSQARDGSLKANGRTVVLSTGQRMFAGSSQEAD